MLKKVVFIFTILVDDSATGNGVLLLNPMLIQTESTSISSAPGGAGGGVCTGLRKLSASLFLVLALNYTSLVFQHVHIYLQNYQIELLTIYTLIKVCCNKFIKC